MRKFLSVLFVGSLALCANATAGDLVVVEGAIVTHDSAARVVYIKECDTCKSVKLNVDDKTVVMVNEKPYPFKSTTKLAAPSDTAYDNVTLTVQYFRPLKISR